MLLHHKFKEGQNLGQPSKNTYQNRTTLLLIHVFKKNFTYPNKKKQKQKCKKLPRKILSKKKTKTHVKLDFKNLILIP